MKRLLRGLKLLVHVIWNTEFPTGSYRPIYKKPTLDATKPEEE